MHLCMKKMTRFRAAARPRTTDCSNPRHCLAGGKGGARGEKRGRRVLERGKGRGAHLPVVKLCNSSRRTRLMGSSESAGWQRCWRERSQKGRGDAAQEAQADPE